MKKIFITFFFTLTLLSPVAVFAQSSPPIDYSGFVKCDGVVVKNADGSAKPGEDRRQNECNFYWLMKTITLGVNWMFVITIPVATALFAYGGLLHMTGRPDKISDARKIFTSVGIGFIIMITAWVVVRTGVDALLDPAFGTSPTLLVK